MADARKASAHFLFTMAALLALPSSLCVVAGVINVAGGELEGAFWALLFGLGGVAWAASLVRKGVRRRSSSQAAAASATADAATPAGTPTVQYGLGAPRWFVPLTFMVAAAGGIFWWAPWEDDDEKGAAKVSQGLAPPPADRSSDAIAAAQQLVSKHLRSPASASWPSTRVVAQEPPRYLVHVVVDAQNALGAVLRSSFLVAVELKGAGQFSYSEGVAVHQAGNPPTAQEIEVVKSMNAWPSGSGQSADPKAGVLPAGALRGGYKNAKWGMTEGEVKQALGLPQNLDLTKSNARLDGNAQAGFEFHDGRLIAVNYFPDISFSERQEKGNLVKDALVEKYGIGKSVTGFVDGDTGLPMEIARWEDGETSIEFRRAHQVFVEYESIKLAAEKAGANERRSAAADQERAAREAKENAAQRSKLADDL